jgi:hypothetical protein
MSKRLIKRMSDRVIARVSERVIGPGRGERRGQPALGGVEGHVGAPHDD